MIYEYDKRQWTRGDAWEHLWMCFLATPHAESARRMPGTFTEPREFTNPFRKCHGADVWRWEGVELGAPA